MRERADMRAMLGSKRFKDIKGIHISIHIQRHTMDICAHKRRIYTENMHICNMTDALAICECNALHRDAIWI